MVHGELDADEVLTLRFDLVTLLVEDIETSRSFYRDVLGLDVAKDARGYVELASGSGRLALYSRSQMSDLLKVPLSSGSSVLSFLVEDLDGIFQDVARRGAEILTPPGVMPWGRRLAFVMDPDRNVIELCADP
jgi:lactoylglutathione lyase